MKLKKMKQEHLAEIEGILEEMQKETILAYLLDLRERVMDAGSEPFHNEEFDCAIDIYNAIIGLIEGEIYTVSKEVDDLVVPSSIAYIDRFYWDVLDKWLANRKTITEVITDDPEPMI